MRIPWTPYEVAHIRKALGAGIGGVVALLPLVASGGISTNEFYTLIGAFVLPALGAFGISNKQVVQAVQVVEAVDPAVKPVLTQIVPPVAPSATAD